ncbi:MAG: aspartate-semialdehyde dehydrogenase [Clostridia bacterium]
MSKYKVGIIGATGMVGQRFATLLENHAWFEVSALAASSRSKGKTYKEAARWSLDQAMPKSMEDMIIFDASEDAETIASMVDFVFCAVDMDKKAILALEEKYAKLECPVVSNNSANRGTVDVPMIIPEINAEHSKVIEQQKVRLGTKRGFIAVKSNCSIQSYVPALSVLDEYGIKNVTVCTYQAISGAGKTFETAPEILDNIIPYIGGEEEKSEKEPMKVWGKVTENGIENATSPVITAQCIRVPVKDGHMAAVFVKFDKKPTMEQILDKWANFENTQAHLPSAPEKFLTYFEEDNRPQTGLDRDLYGGMGVSIGRLREDHVYDYKFVSLSHNTLRGAAGGAVLMAELLCDQGYITKK